jgi:hypothetical protein
MVGSTDVLALAALGSFAGSLLLLQNSFSVDFYNLSSIYIGEFNCKIACKTEHKNQSR